MPRSVEYSNPTVQSGSTTGTPRGISPLSVPILAMRKSPNKIFSMIGNVIPVASTPPILKKLFPSMFKDV